MSERPRVTARLVAFDRLLLLWVVAHRIEPLNPLLWGISVIGRGGLVWLAIGTGLMLARRVRVRGVIRLALALLLASLCVDHLLKPIVNRERPFAATPTIHVIGRPPLDGSFPSGHSANAFAGAYVLSCLVPAARAPWWALAMTIAYSRIYLGVHYPLDVAGGAAVGILSGIAVMALTSPSTRRRPPAAVHHGRCRTLEEALTCAAAAHNRIMPSARRWTLVATIIGSSLAFVDTTVVNVALPALQADLHATITDVQWVIEAYALFLGALILVGGSMGDQFGRKRVFLAGVVLFTTASVLCGLAGSAHALIAGRALQGIGAAFLVPGSLAIISATFDEAERGRAIGTWSGFSAMTSAVGPIVGGWLIEHVSWRAVFFLNVPLAAAVVVLSWRFMTESRDPSRTGQIDWSGAALAVLGLGGLVFALLEWPQLGLNGLVQAALAAGAGSLVLLVFVERRAPSPMLPLHLFRSRTFALTNLLTLLLYAAVGITLFIVPMNLIQVQHYSATAAGAAFLPFPVIMFALSRWSGGLVARTGSRLPLTMGPIIAAIGLGLYERPAVGASFWTTFFPAVVVLGFGMAVTVAPLTTTVMSALEREHAGVASGVNNAVARVAGLLAIAVFGVLLVQTFDARVRPRLERLHFTSPAWTAIDRELPKMAGADVEAVPAIEQSKRRAARQAIDEAFVSAFRLVMMSAAVLALAAAIAGSLVR